MTSGYYLISKIIGMPYYKYQGDALRLINQSARTVDEVVVGVKNNLNIKRKVTTFKDSKGNILERAFDYSDKPYRNRFYKKLYNIIGKEEFVTSTHIKEYELPRNLKKAHLQMVNARFHRTLLWNPIKFFTNHCSENILTGEKILTQVLQTNLLKPQKEKHTFIEFPHIIKRKISKTDKKILKFSVNTLNNHKVNIKDVFEKGTKLPVNDSFLGFRALDINDSKMAFAQKFLSAIRLKDKGITINPEYLPINNEEEMSKALFDPNKGTLNFVKTHIFTSKAEVVSTARHEAEHGWQFFLHARNTKGGTTEWEESIYRSFGNLPSKLKEEAQEYTDSIRSYISIGVDKVKYRKNYIEIKANEKGTEAREQYNSERKEISDQFPHIPKELL